MQSNACASVLDEFYIAAPDDFHLHIRDGEFMQSVLPHVLEEFERAIIMPNLQPPITTVDAALAYRQRILNAIKKTGSQQRFTPLMTLYLTDRTSPQEIYKARESGHIFAVKLYPAGATTNSESGVTDMNRVFPTLEAMARVGMPLLLHGEVTDPTVDIFDREKEFIERTLRSLVATLPTLKIVMEHITTKEAVEFVKNSGPNVAGTITAHHLLCNRNAIFKNGLQPHFYCLPVLKSEQDRQALLAAATSGNAKFFAGTDSAPHPKHLKEKEGGHAGCYTSYGAIGLYATAFHEAGRLDKLESFLSRHGAAFYSLPPNKGQVVVRRQEWKVPKEMAYGGTTLVPFLADQTLAFHARKMLPSRL